MSSETESQGVEKQKRPRAGRPGTPRGEFGVWLAQKRAELGLTQAQTAARLGVSTVCISVWERGLRTPYELTRVGIMLGLRGKRKTTGR